MSLSYDILFCILIRVPIKSLLRFQSVSKLCSTIISDDKFKKAHCDQSRALGRLKFLLHKRRSTNTTDVDKIEFVELENPQIVIEKQRLPLSSSHVICSHDGLVLLHTHKAYDTFILWNPSIRQHKIFVCPYLNNSSILPNGCGLCYDSTIDDYKIILIYKSFYLVCYTNNNFWTMKKPIPILEQSLEDDICCDFITGGISTCGGRVYWSLDSPSSSSSQRKFLFQHVNKSCTIIRFNAKSDELEELPTPDFIGEMELYLMSTLNGCLSLYGGKIEESNVWIMEQDEWKLLVKISRIMPCLRSIKVLCCTKDGEVIFHESMHHFLFTFNPRKETLNRSFYRPHNYNSECVYQDPTCLDSFSFPRLNDEALEL